MGGWQLLACLLASLLMGTNCQYTAEQMRQVTLKARKLPNNVCGESAAVDKKIINGEPADLGAYPWMAAIGVSLYGHGPVWGSAGSLITDQYVLTAAHCVDPRVLQRLDPYEVTHVRLGDLDLDDSKPDRAQPVDVLVDSVVWHPQYSNVTKANDIGLVKLKRKVTFSELLKPICLPSADLHFGNFFNRSFVIAGWGRTVHKERKEEGGDTAIGNNGFEQTALQEASVMLTSLEECRTNMTRAIRNAIIDNRVVCAVGRNERGLVDSCEGDSGGPMMIFQRSNGTARMHIYGVVSYGTEFCAEQGYPGVYTRVSQFFPWILQNLDI